MSNRILLDERLWERAAAAMVQRAYKLAREGVLTPPIRCTIAEVSEAGEDGLDIFECCLPDMGGASSLATTSRFASSAPSISPCGS